MKFIKNSRRLYSQNGTLIKELYCPKKVVNSDLKLSEDGINYDCKYCQSKILDTSYLTEKQIITIVKKNPNTCLKISTNQKNIIFIENEY